MQYPKISVVTPSYNQGRFLEETIVSVLSQNYPNLEYIILDGGSTDNSVEIIKKYADKLTYWQSKPDGGQSAAINEGFRRATGDIYCWLNSDDRFTEGALKVVGEYFANHTDCQWLSGRAITVNTRNKIIAEITPPSSLNYNILCNWYKNYISQPSTFWRKGIWNQYNGVDEKLNYSMDVDLWLSFSKSIDGNTIDEILSISLSHPNAKTRNKDSYLSFLETGLVLCKHGELEEARNLLNKVVKRAFQIGSVFAAIKRILFLKQILSFIRWNKK